MDAAALTQVERRLLSVPEAAQSLGISRAMTYRLIATGELRSITIGDRRLVRVSAVDDYIERLTAQQTV
jgi:excisionase family DNA binding protein